jgi:hypothetical protein
MVNQAYFAWVMAEELAHVVQWNTWGYVAFAAQYISWHAMYGYRGNPFEIGARDYRDYMR